MGTKTRPTRNPNTAANLDAVAGAFGYPVTQLAGVEVEIRLVRDVDGEQQLSSVAFPVPGTGGAWAVVQLGCPGRWMVGFGGWQHDEFPTIEAAVSAIRDPAQRRLIEARTKHYRAIGELEQRARDMRANPPAAPTGAAETR
jgi:hypothetical protein